MFTFKVIDFYRVSFSVNLVRRFRVLQNIPKCWEEITSCTTIHGTYESGSTTIYQSKTTKKYYMVRYFDGCFNKMYAEVSGVDWRKLKDAVHGFWDRKSPIRHEMWERCHNGEMSYAEKNARENKMREDAKAILLGMVG